MPDDFDLALRRLKTDLALLDLRRELIHKPLDARSTLALTSRILELQRAQPSRWKRWAGVRALIER